MDYSKRLRNIFDACETEEEYELIEKTVLSIKKYFKLAVADKSSENDSQDKDINDAYTELYDDLSSLDDLCERKGVERLEDIDLDDEIRVKIFVGKFIINAVLDQ